MPHQSTGQPHNPEITTMFSPSEVWALVWPPSTMEHTWLPKSEIPTEQQQSQRISLLQLVLNREVVASGGRQCLFLWLYTAIQPLQWRRCSWSNSGVKEKWLPWPSVSTGQGRDQTWVNLILIFSCLPLPESPAISCSQLEADSQQAQEGFFEIHDGRHRNWLTQHLSSPLHVPQL